MSEARPIMNIDKPDLDEAVAQQILSSDQATRLLAFLEARPQRGRFTGLNVAYYAGALIVMGAMGWLMNSAWERLGGWGLFGVASLYATLFLLASRSVPAIPSGLLVTMAVSMTPLAVYGLERAVGLWPGESGDQFRGFFPYIRSSWVFMEAATVAAGAVAIWRKRFPFTVAPIAVALWFMSMDFAALLEHRSDEKTAVIFGLAMLFVAYLADHRTREDFAFWLYLAGMTALWGGLSTMHSDSELNKLAYAGLNVVFIAFGVLLQRRVFVVYGAIGANWYLYHLSDRVFRDSLAFPFVLTLLGLGIIAAAVQAQKNWLKLDGWVQSVTPSWLRDLLPQARLSAER